MILVRKNVQRLDTTGPQYELAINYFANSQMATNAVEILRIL